MLIFYLDDTAQHKHCFNGFFLFFKLCVMYPSLRTVSFHHCFIYPDTDSCQGTDPPSPSKYSQLSPLLSAEVRLQPQLWWSSSLQVRMSVTRPVPMVLFPSLNVNLWPFSRIIGWRSVSVKVVSSPGITISWKKGRIFFLIHSKVTNNCGDFCWTHALTWTSNFARTFIGIMYSIALTITTTL